jgi:hypothetical protein
MHCKVHHGCDEVSTSLIGSHHLTTLNICCTRHTYRLIQLESGTGLKGSGHTCAKLGPRRQKSCLAWISNQLVVMDQKGDC